MTGTPLQNNTQELWTLLNFIEPGLFRSLEEFEHNFGNMANREQVEALQRKISPFMLRRVRPMCFPCDCLFCVDTMRRV